MYPDALIMGQSLGGDNQQRSLELRLSWLGGIIDGEGMITFSHRKTRTKSNWNPKISVVNTDITIINEVTSIYDALGIPYYVQFKKGKGTWKDKYEVMQGGFKRASKVLPVIIPYLIAKRYKAELAMTVINRRLAAPRTSWAQEDIDVIAKIRQSHTTGSSHSSKTPRDYTQNASPIGEVKI